MDDAYTIEELIDIDLHGKPCPECGGDSLDTGLGFGNRDLDCNTCDFSESYPADRYLAALHAMMHPEEG